MRAAIDPAGTMTATGLTSVAFINLVAVMIQLANGFFLTAMLWAAWLAFLIDRRIVAAAATLGVCALLALVGFIHSVLPTGGIYLPWQAGSMLPWHWAVAYVGLAGVVVVLGRTAGVEPSASQISGDSGILGADD
jgi:AGZA family xanthine/uracil permease-like MFS transporter